MKCEECKWFYWVEDDEKERSICRDKWNKLIREVAKVEENAQDISDCFFVMNTGYCQRHPPAYCGKDETGDAEFRQPFTLHNHNCGEFKAKANELKDAQKIGDLVEASRRLG